MNQGASFEHELLEAIYNTLRYCSRAQHRSERQREEGNRIAGAGITASGNFVVKSSGFDQFVTGFTIH